MCLVSENKIPLISTYNIVCYKILVSVGGKLFTPYRDFIFNIGETITDKTDENISEVFGKFMIEGGYFHSYVNLDTAKEKVKEIRRKLPKGKTVKIFEAEVPEGTYFYEGQFKDICSKSLKIIEECFDLF